MFELYTVSSYESDIVSREKFQMLVDDYSGQILNTAVRILGDPEKAKDVHQEVFLAIWKRWHKYNGQTNWDAYLYRVTVRKAIEFARRSKFLRGGSDDGIISHDSPDEFLVTEELQKKLTECLAKIPTRQAEVFVLSRVEGLKAKRIADILGCSQQTVRVHLHRALKRLARELGDYLTG